MEDGRMTYINVSTHRVLTSFYFDAGLEINEGWEKESGVFLSEAVIDRTAHEGENNGLEKESRYVCRDDGKCVERENVILNENASCDQCSAVKSKNIVAAYSVSMRYGVAVLDYIAVKKDRRKSGLGCEILKRIKEKCRDMCLDRLYLTAKAKGFFLKNGAIEIFEDSPLYLPLLGDCAECSQRGKECSPAVMMIKIDT